MNKRLMLNFQLCFLFACLSIVLLLFIPIESKATLIADLRTDYIPGTADGDIAQFGTTGSGTWEYLASNFLTPPIDITDPNIRHLEWSIAGGGYDDQNNNNSHYGHPAVTDHPSIWTLNPDELRIYPGDTDLWHPPDYLFGVMRWTAGAGEGGTINISGNVRKLDTTSGDGITFGIFVDSSSVFSQTIPYGDNVGVGFNYDVTISEGSFVDFVIGPNGFDEWDNSALSAKITLTEPIPEPATMLLLGSGLIGLAGFRRKMKNIRQ